MNDYRTSIENILRTIVSFGPRAIGSEAERKSADFIEKHFQQAGIEVERQNFTASFFPLIVAGKIITGLTLVILILSAVLYTSHPLITLILLGLLLVQVPLVMFAVAGSRLSKIGQRFPTCNLIGRVSGEKKELPTILLVAHYDSKSQSLNMAWRVILFLVPVAMATILFAATLLHLIGIFAVPVWAIWLIVALAGICLTVLFFSQTSNRSPGAIDNGSGVAILLSLAERLPAKISQQVNLVFLATGAEEVGLAGAIQFVRADCQNLRQNRTLVMNLDGLGCGGVVTMAGLKKFGQFQFADQAKTSLKEHGFSVRHYKAVPGVGLDHIPFMRAGYSAVSFTQGSGKSARRMHSPRDVIESVDFDELARLAQAFETMIERSANTCNESGK
jgi:acetylornithine deacetylase/succinyl-diaminopimelate desuccinylase-like protein